MHNGVKVVGRRLGGMIEFRRNFSTEISCPVRGGENDLPSVNIAVIVKYSTFI